MPQYAKGCCCENCQEGIFANELQKMRMIQLHMLWSMAAKEEWKVSIIKCDFGIYLQIHDGKAQVSNDCI
jgi:hypothetical protein